MTITITLTPDEEHQLAERAARLGLELTSYVQNLIEKDIRNPQAAEAALEPFRRQVEQSGISDEELDAFFEEVRDEVWNDKSTSASQTHHQH
jgi:membrane-bound lytic murein transglycosylase B